MNKTNFEKIKGLNEKEMILFIMELCELSYKTNMELFSIDIREAELKKGEELDESEFEFSEEYSYAMGEQIIKNWLNSKGFSTIEEIKGL